MLCFLCCYYLHFIHHSELLRASLASQPTTKTAMSEEFRNLVLELRQEFQRQRAHNSKTIDEQGAHTRKEISFLKRELKRLKSELLAWFIGLLMVQGVLLVLVIQALNSVAS